MRPFLGLSGQDMKKFGRAGSRPEMMFDANPVLVGKAVPRDYMSTNPLAPTLVARYAKGGPAHLTGASNAGRNYEAQQGLDQFMQFLVDRVREMASKRNQPEEQKIEIEVEAGEEAPEPEEKARGGYLKGGTSGQSDKVPAMLSDGEYVIDSDVVSALGDGNNEAGAAKLDAMRKNIRTHKRSAPADKIPPKAKAPEAYMKGKK